LDTSLSREARIAMLIERAELARQQQVASGEGMPGPVSDEPGEIEAALDLLGGVPHTTTPTREGTLPTTPHFTHEPAQGEGPVPGSSPDTSGGGLPCSRSNWSRCALPAVLLLGIMALAGAALTVELPPPILYTLAVLLLVPGVVCVGLLLLYFMARHRL
jgi:hypothetical protein